MMYFLNKSSFIRYYRSESGEKLIALSLISKKTCELLTVPKKGTCLSVSPAVITEVGIERILRV